MHFAYFSSEQACYKLYKTKMQIKMAEIDLEQTGFTSHQTQMLKSTSVPKQKVTFPDSVFTLIELKRNGTKATT